MKININQIDLNNVDETYEFGNTRRKVKKVKFKDPLAKGRGKKPKKFRDYNKGVSK
jgi:hypothetical protein|tara:strand:+ start:303 stop:470 length:168 start_codon:yes stop_codon:yes gene_type:complete